MKYLGKTVMLFMLVVALHATDGIVDSSSAFQAAQTEIPEFSNVTKELDVKPLEGLTSGKVVRMIRDTGWYCYALTVHIPLNLKQEATVELKHSSFDASVKENIVKTTCSTLTVSESKALQDALNTPKAFEAVETKNSISPTDSGWFFVEMQAGADYRSLMRTGFTTTSSGRQELAAAMWQIFKRMQSGDGHSEGAEPTRQP